MADKTDKPVVNFAVLQSVEDYVEKSGKFRTNCASFKIPGRDSGGANTAYIPYCDKQHFDFGHQLNEYRGHGVFKPPQTGKWTRKEIVTAVVVPVAICLVGALLAWVTPEGRRLLHLDKPQPQQQTSS